MINTKLAVIGAGPGGYTAAFHAADLGLDTTLIDPNSNPGGVCLYRGCIPSKALLHVAKRINEVREAKNLGIDFGEPKINLDRLRSWKDQVVTKMTSGLGQLCSVRRLNTVQGRATFLDPHTLSVEKSDGTSEMIKFENAIIATGSRPIRLPNSPKSDRILDSTSALEIADIPKNLLIVGGGYIGLELGTVYAALGTEVTIAEMENRLLIGVDNELVYILQRSLKKRFREIMLNTKVLEMIETENGISVKFSNGNSDQEFEKVLIAISRKPNTDAIGLENSGVEIDQFGFVVVDDQRRTNCENIFAIGDVAGQPMLAHKASHEGKIAVEVIAGKNVTFDPKAIPAVVFTDPEIAWCGLTEIEAKKRGIEIVVSRFPWLASGRAVTLDRTDGVTKFISDPKTRRVLGVGIAGVGAGELISEAALGLELSAVLEDFYLTIHPHPTLSETLMESAEMPTGFATHVFRPKKK